MQPVIGITTYDRAERPSPTEHYAAHYSVPTEYVDAVRRAGGVAVLLPPGEENWTRWMDIVDGVVIAGGTDISPERYGGNSDHPLVSAKSVARDESELALATALVNSEIPSLFVCRGMQVLNVALGGTLHAHLPDVIDDDIHRDEDGFWTTHVVDVTVNSRLANAMRTEQVTTYSGHHQALDRLSEALTITAVAPDGIIEAVEVQDHPWLVAVQWHPEVSAAIDPTQQALFDALISHA